MSAARYWHTLKHLRPGQVLGRLWFHAYRPAVDSRPAPALRSPKQPWRAPAWREPSLLDSESVTFLNVRASVQSAETWNDPSRGRLWLYNLHYFDDLTASDFQKRRAWHEALIDRWIHENPAGEGAGWEPYPTSLRIGNWTKWLLAATEIPVVLREKMQGSLATQARWLGKRMETHLRGNHLWANAKALVMAGTFFSGPEAEGWRRHGLRVLASEIDEQILPDGGHFERSPMYHAIVLEDVLDLVQLSALFPNVLPEPVVLRLKSVATRMLRWLQVMSHPDGQVSFFNDAAFGIAAPWPVLAAYADTVSVEVDRRPLGKLEALPDSGYIRLENERATVICDVAPVGPDYQPAHAHADTLSFELSLDGRRVVVNGGTSTYSSGPERARQRSTAAHNTVEVDHADSSDVWESFRVGRRARTFDIHSGTSKSGVSVEAAHDGYRHRPGRVIHRRSWLLEAGSLTVTDTIEGSWTSAVARFILHPDATADSTILRIETDPRSDVTRVRTSWHPAFGESIDTEAVEVRLTTPAVVTRLRWT